MDRETNRMTPGLSRRAAKDSIRDQSRPPSLPVPVADPKLHRRGSPPEYTTSVTLLLIGVNGLVGTILIGRLSSRSVYAALVAAPVTVAVGFAVLFFSGGSLVIVLLAQTGFAAGATVGRVTLDSFGVATISLVASAFVVGSIIIATTLRNTLRNATVQAPGAGTSLPQTPPKKD